MAEIQSGTKYKITNVKGGTVLDLSGEDGCSIIGYTYNEGDNQHWIMESTDNGWYVKNAQSDQFLAVNGEPGDGANLIASDDPFEWHVWNDEANPDYHRLFVPDTHQNMDLSDHGNSNDGTPVTLWYKWEGENQTWKFEEV